MPASDGVDALVSDVAMLGGACAEGPGPLPSSEYAHPSTSRRPGNTLHSTMSSNDPTRFRRGAPMPMADDEPARNPLRVWVLAWPTIVGFGAQTLVRFADFVMVSGLGPEALAAVGPNPFTLRYSRHRFCDRCHHARWEIPRRRFSRGRQPRRLAGHHRRGCQHEPDRPFDPRFCAAPRHDLFG